MGEDTEGWKGETSPMPGTDAWNEKHHGETYRDTTDPRDYGGDPDRPRGKASVFLVMPVRLCQFLGLMPTKQRMKTRVTLKNPERWPK